jgi:hypothetical protein
MDASVGLVRLKDLFSLSCFVRYLAPTIDERNASNRIVRVLTRLSW